MPRVLAVVVVMGLLVWGLVFVDFGRPRTRRSAATGAEQGVKEPAERTRAQAAVKVERDEPVRSAAPPAQAVTPTSPARPTPASKPHASGAPTPSAQPVPVDDTAAPQPAQGALSTATGELGEGNLSPEYAEMERSYAHEPRDGAWAEAEEQRLRKLLDKSPLASAVGLVNCQQTMCRLLLESDDYEVYKRLLAVPGFTSLTGLGPSSPYSHRSGQLSVYFAARDAAQAAR
jgi:hypothetical protein